jgi:hypothetical protein
MPQAFIRRDVLHAWKGSSLLVVTAAGDCGDPAALTGFYYREARFLRTLRFEINRARPWLCEAAAAAPDRLEFTYVYPEVARYGGGGSGQSGDDVPRDRDGLPQRGIDIRVVYQLTVARLDAAVTLRNSSREALTFEFGCLLAADFADIQEAQGAQRQQQGSVETTVTPAGLDFH